jgi:hypothetical protein
VNSLYQKGKHNLAMITMIVLFSILLASINPKSPPFKLDSAFAQLSGQASINGGNDTSALTPPLLPSDQGLEGIEMAANQTLGPSSTNDSILYSNPNLGFSLEFPSDWQKEESLTFVSPQGGIGNRAPEVISITTEVLPTPDYSLDRYTEAALGQVESFQDFRLLNSSSTSLAGLPAHMIVYSFTDEENQTPLQNLQAWTIKDGMAYIITYGGIIEEFDSSLPTLQSVLDTIRLEESLEDSTNSPLIPNYGFPFVEDQQDLILPSSSAASAMDFDMFMNSFGNSIFNGSSIFGGLATSMVNGVKVSGIGLDNNGSRLSVTLSGIPPEVLGGNNTASMTNETIVMTNAESSNSVSVIAMRIPINMADILSLAAASSSEDMGSNMMTGDNGFNQSSIFPSDSFNPFSLLSDLQIGSSSITNADWSVPQTVTMDLVGGNKNQEQKQPYSNYTSAADFVLVSVIPYTGLDS